MLLALGASAKLTTSRYDGTALIAAAHLGHDGVVRQLIAAGAPLDHVNNLHWTAVIEAIVLGDGGPRHQATLQRAGRCRRQPATGRPQRPHAAGAGARARVPSHGTDAAESRCTLTAAARIGGRMSGFHLPLLPTMTAPSYPNTQLFIDGQWCDAADGRTLAVVNPATGEEIGRVAHAGKADLDRRWPPRRKASRPGATRRPPSAARSCASAAALMRERAGDIAALLTQEQGKPLAEAKGEAMAAADIIEWFAEEGLRVYGRIVPSRGNLARAADGAEGPGRPGGGVHAVELPDQPGGAQGRRRAGRRAARCIVKAPEETPAAPAALIQAFADAGVPAGVLGLVYGNPAEISGYLIPHPVIRKITFTGSTPVGKQLAALAGQHMKRVTMELGGHAPVIVAEDADIALAVKAAGAAKFRNAGQVCISPTRFLVHDSIRNEFAQRAGRSRRRA